MFSRNSSEFTGNISKTSDGSKQQQSLDSLAFRHTYLPESPITTITSNASLKRYRVHSTNGVAMVFVVQQLISRLRDKVPAKAAKNLAGSISKQHLQLLESQVDAHFEVAIKEKECLVYIRVLYIEFTRDKLKCKLNFFSRF